MARRCQVIAFSKGAPEQILSMCVDRISNTGPAALNIEALRHQGRRGFDRVAELSRAAGDRLSTPLLPDLEIPLEEIFPS